MAARRTQACACSARRIADRCSSVTWTAHWERTQRWTVLSTSGSIISRKTKTSCGLVGHTGAHRPPDAAFTTCEGMVKPEGVIVHEA